MKIKLIKSIVILSAFIILAALTWVGCTQNSPDNSTDAQSTNSSMSDTNGAANVTTNMTATNSVADTNTNISAGTNQ
jgi:outer membrane lipoprotein-sorting protein